MASPILPVNIHVSNHPCLRAKLSQLRSKDANARETKSLVHEIALIVGCEALAKCLQTTSSGTGETPLGYTFSTETITPNVALVPVLRSGLDSSALQTLLPDPVPVHHLGLFREPTTLQPVEYYNNLPYHRPTSVNPDPFPIPSIAILLDPLIATGGTSSAAIQTLLEWGVRKVVVISVLGSEEGVRRAAEENGSESVEVWVGGLDGQVDERGMIRPGLGDVGDRLFLTIGK
ncbi:MAG: hypothetical protein ASARMPRED_008354 [Alectoria sarmentosa]|nr:MAG: hypothetical protein ASARMPRED_008354 [Alectoria sarmentosa]